MVVPLPRLPAAAAVTLLKLSTPPSTLTTPVMLLAPEPSVSVPGPVLTKAPPAKGALRVRPPVLCWWMKRVVEPEPSAPVPLMA